MYTSEFYRTACEFVNGKWSSVKTKLTISLFILSLISFVSTLTLYVHSVSDLHSDASCINKGTIFSPLRSAIKYQWVNFGDYFYPQSVYRGPSTEQLEQAWQDLIHQYEVNIPDSVVSRLDQSPSTKWKRHGEGGVSAEVAIFYQLRCLNLMRLHTHADLNDIFRAKWRTELDDCIENFRHKLMCDGDVTPNLIWNNPKLPKGDGVDFHTMHKCRSYSDIENWAYTNAWGN